MRGGCVRSADRVGGFIVPSGEAVKLSEPCSGVSRCSFLCAVRVMSLLSSSLWS